MTPDHAEARRILFVVNSSWNVVNFRSGLIRGLMAAGYHVIVAAPRDSYTPAVEALGCDYRELPIDPLGRSPLADMVLFGRLVRMIRRERPYAALSYTPKANVYVSLAAKVMRLPVINNIPGLGRVFNETGFVPKLLKALYRVSLDRSRRIFFQNDDDMQIFLAARLVPRDRVDLLPGSGVDLARFVPIAPEVGQPMTFLLVARLLWEKGVAEYVEAGRNVRARHPNVRLRILGFIDEGSAAGISRAQIEAWQAEGAIEYLGETADVRPHLAAADCVVLPSYYREGTPRTLLEAAACGKPIITTDMPGCRNVVVDGVNGYLVAPRDRDALAAAMLRVVEQARNERDAMGAASRAKAEHDYDEEIVIAKYLDALAAIGSAKEPSSG